MPTLLPGPVTATCPSPAGAPLLRAMGYKCCPLLTQPYLCLVCDPLVSLPSLTLQSELPNQICPFFYLKLTLYIDSIYATFINNEVIK